MPGRAPDDHAQKVVTMGLLHKVPQLRYLIQELLQIRVADFVRQARYQSLRLLGALAAQATYEHHQPQDISMDLKGSQRPNCDRSKYSSSSCVANILSTASMFSFCLKRAKTSR